MSHNSPDGHSGSDDDVRPEDAGARPVDDARDTDQEQGLADETPRSAEAQTPAETDVIPTRDDHPTDRYTAPYPTVGERAADGAQRDGSAEQPSQYGQSQGSRYSQGSQYGQQSQGSPYGQQSQQSQYGGSQYGQQSQQSQGSPYGQSQGSPYGQQSQGSQYGQSQGSQYGQSQGSQYGQQSQGSQYGQQSQGSPYGQSQGSQYGQSSQYGGAQYGRQPQGSQYGQSSQYGQQPYGQSPSGQQQDRPRYGEYAAGAATGAAASHAPGSAAAPGSAYTAPGSSQAPTSAFGDLDGASRANGHYFGGDAGAPATTTRSSGNGRRLLIPAAALVVGALVGGISGAGWVAATSADGGTTTSSSTSSQSGGNLTVNDYNSATVVTAVAAKATPSVVTINVSAGNEAGTGSGVVVSKDGYIVTNTHVVTLDGDSGSGQISVTTSGGKIYTGKLIGTDPTVDLAVIKIDASDMQPISFADSSKLNVGDTAVAIGAPLGLSNTVTDGIVSTLNRSIQVTSSAPQSGGDSNEGGNNGNGPYDFWGNGDNGSSGSASTVSLPVIQTDASINPGNSGGALLDSKGRLIGINVAIASAGSSSSSEGQSGSIGVGFSIPSNLVERVSKEIIDSGSATHGLLGATVGDAASEANATQVGAAIRSVSPGGAAAEAGLEKGDVVTKIGSASVADATDLTAQVRYFAGGAKTEITYVRGGQQRTAEVTLGTYKS